MEQELQAILPNLEQLDSELLSRSFSDYVQKVWPLVEPSTRYLHTWHIDLMCEYLEAVTIGQIKRLIINIPPRHMKSLLVSVLWPTWTWTHQPHSRWLLASYVASLSIRDSVKRRSILESQWYRDRWGDKVELAKDQNQKTEFQNARLGHMIVSSVGGSVTGVGGDYIVIDDPLDPRRAVSDVQRETANQWMDQVISTRLNDKRTGAIVVIMQRLHEKDVTGHLLSKKDESGVADWHHLELPAITEKKTVVHFPLTHKEIVREVGDLIWPAKEDEILLHAQKRSMGSYAFSGQYQQSPSPAGGGVVKEKWWRYYNPQLLVVEQLDQMIQSWDMSFKDTMEGSYVVGQVWGRKGANKYLLDQVRKRIDFPQTIMEVKAMCVKWPQTTAKLIEDKANGPAVISTLHNHVSGIVAITPQGGKEARCAAISPQIEAGNVYLPDPQVFPWVEDFVLEFAKFPLGENDDQVDSASQALNYMPSYIDRNGSKMFEESMFVDYSGQPIRHDGGEEGGDGFSKSNWRDMEPW